jgi:hypothetical protein
VVAVEVEATEMCPVAIVGRRTVHRCVRWCAATGLVRQRRRARVVS